MSEKAKAGKGAGEEGEGEGTTCHNRTWLEAGAEEEQERHRPITPSPPSSC